MPSFRLFLGFILVISTTSSAWSHDPLTATVQGRVDKAGLTFRVTMASCVAAYLAGVSERPRLKFARETFASNKVLFERVASDLCILRSGAVSLQPSSTLARLTLESDVEFEVTFPNPSNGNFSFEATWLSKLPVEEGYNATFTMEGKSNHVVGGPFLNKERLALDFQVTSDSPTPLILHSELSD
jgi:hypothetical protein